MEMGRENMILVCKNKFCIYNSNEICIQNAESVMLDERGICQSCMLLDRKHFSEWQLELYRKEQRIEAAHMRCMQMLEEEQFPPACHK